MCLRRVAALSAVAGYVELTGFVDFAGTYPGIMTGNTVQFGLSMATAEWARLGIFGYAIAMFFIGGALSSAVKHWLRTPTEVLVMVALLTAASTFRLIASARWSVELPLLAFVMALQGQAVAKFGGLSLQTIVVTNNVLKFSDALVGRYLLGRKRSRDSVPSLREVLAPGCAWLSYALGAVAAAIAIPRFQFPLLIPTIFVLVVLIDLMTQRIDYS
ncbi:YoaK family protein [uncultured Caballeronia sp.]|uniref:YoaK family protein n=1 Tax=uncultured Caballeronia sp. TaxID=1827198 RepID=UPI0035CA2221